MSAFNPKHPGTARFLSLSVLRFHHGAIKLALAMYLLCGCSGFISAQNVAYPKLEASFNVTNSIVDPFDYTQADLRVQIQQPDGTTLSLPAFFDGSTTWRVRHTPLVAGYYSVSAVTLNGSVIQVNNLQPASWYVSGFPANPGFVRVDPANSSRFITSNGRRFFPMGHDNAWDVTTVTNVANLLGKMGAAHENWSRVWMDDWDGKNLDWPKPGPFGQLSLTVAQKWDAIVTAAEQAGVHFQMTLHHHGQYSTAVDPEWSSNPYNTANGGFLSDPKQFFTNTTAVALTQRKLRYIVARWGYSMAIMGWELFNEVQFTDAGQAAQWTVIGSWHNQMAAFLRAQDPYQHLVTTSSDITAPIWDQLDYYQHHDYPSDLIGAIADPPQITSSQKQAPNFGGECGMDFTPHIGLSPTVWAGLMAAQSGAEQPWYWDVIDANNDYTLMRAAADFTIFSGLGNQSALAKSAPAVTCAEGSSLVFAPGGGYANATQSTFTVGLVAPPGIGSLPSFLQGNFHRSMTPNGYTFLVNYPQAGTFSVQITEIAASGDALQVTVDALSTNTVSFPSTGSDYSTNFTLNVNVPAGAHTVKLVNPGQDWIVLGNLTLNPYVPMIGAYQVSNPRFAALWLWHRTNIFSANVTNSLAAQVSLSGLAPGTYSGVWWDTYAGTALSNLSFSVVNTNTPVVLNAPAISRSVAFYAGLPPQASVIPVPLTQTIGTNSPSFTVPLVISNAGGLPLNYSLAVTNANPVTYTALNSTQPGGPCYAWTDISGVGTDITGNFTALAGPKVATDEGIAGPFNIGFNFPFFSGAQTPGVYNQLYVSPNGFISFSPFAGDTSTARTIPGALSPSNSIALYWRDLALGTAGHVYTFRDLVAGTFTVQYQNVPIKGGGGVFTGQIILKPTGEILLQYRNLGTPNTATIGLQNAAQNQGLTVASQANYLQTSFAIQLSASPWLSFDSIAGFVPGSNNLEVNVAFNAAGLPPGNYQATLAVNTSDPLLPVTILPVNFTISANLPAAPSNLVPDAVTWSHVTIAWTNNSDNATGFEIQRALGNNGSYVTIGVAGASATNFTDVTATSQTTYYYRVIATNNFGASLPGVSVAATTPLAPVDLWRLAHFNTTTNSGVAGDGADPDHDGRVNLIEYSFASDPNVPSPDPVSFATITNHLNVIFRRPHPAPVDINYIVETTSDLTSGTWNSGPGAATLTVVNNNDGTETVTLADTEPVDSTSTRYLRVRIGRQ